MAERLLIEQGTTTMPRFWNDPEAMGASKSSLAYDVVGQSLDLLRSTPGLEQGHSFGCLAHDQVGLDLPHPAAPRAAGLRIAAPEAPVTPTISRSGADIIDSTPCMAQSGASSRDDSTKVALLPEVDRRAAQLDDV